MAISFQSKLDQSSATTIAFDVGSGTNRCILVGVMRRGGSTISVTYAGTAMTQLGSLASVWNGGDTMFLFYLANPTSGSNNIAITHNGTLVRTTAACYNGINQTTPVGNYTTHQSASSAAQSVSVTPSVSSWIFATGWIAVATTLTPDANTTMRTTGSAGANPILDSNSNKTSAYALGYSDSLAGDLLACSLVADTSQNLNVDLVSYWKLDESSGNAVDSVDSNTLTNTSVTYSTGKINNGSVFNGTTAFFDGGDIGAFEGIGAMSLSLWVYPTLADTRQMLVSKDLSAQRSFVLEKSPSGGAGDDRIGFFIGDGTAGECSTNDDITLNAWTLINLVYNKSGATNADKVKIYFNGVNKTLTFGTSFSGIDIPATTSKFQIGAREFVGSRVFYTGTIDEVGVWSRALTSAEITSLYNAGSGFQYPFPTSLDVSPSALSATATLNVPTLALIDMVTVSPPVLAITATFNVPSLQVGIWENLQKNSTTWTNVSKNSTTWTEQSKATTSWTNLPKT